MSFSVAQLKQEREGLSTISDSNITEFREAPICFYYGNFGSGKTYAATADILRLLSRGYTVYVTWQIFLEDFDQRNSVRHILLGLIGKRRFYKFSHENLHFVPLEDVDKVYPTTTDCHWFIDEGHLWLNSYVGTKMDLKKMAGILHTRHFSRVVNIISQRPTAVHTSFRSNVNIFYKCKKFLSWPFVIFVRLEYQDMANDTVDEEAKPKSTRWYLANPKVFKAYDSKYMRGDTPRSQPIYGEYFDVPYLKRFGMFINLIFLGLPAAVARRFSERPRRQARKKISAVQRDSVRRMFDMPKR